MAIIEVADEHSKPLYMFTVGEWMSYGGFRSGYRLSYS